MENGIEKMEERKLATQNSRLKIEDRSIVIANLIHRDTFPALLARLKSQPAAKGTKARRRWTRDELYEDDK